MAYFTVMTPSELLLSPAVAMVRRWQPLAGVKFNHAQMNSTQQTALLLLFRGPSVDIRRQSLLSSVVDRSSLCCLFYIQCSKWKLLHRWQVWRAPTYPRKPALFFSVLFLWAQGRQVQCLKWRPPPPPPPPLPSAPLFSVHLSLRISYVSSREGHMVQILSFISLKHLTPSPAIIFNVSPASFSTFFSFLRCIQARVPRAIYVLRCSFRRLSGFFPVRHSQSCLYFRVF